MAISVSFLLAEISRLPFNPYPPFLQLFLAPAYRNLTTLHNTAVTCKISTWVKVGELVQSQYRVKPIYSIMSTQVRVKGNRKPTVVLRWPCTCLMNRHEVAN